MKKEDAQITNEDIEKAARTYYESAADQSGDGIPAAFEAGAEWALKLIKDEMIIRIKELSGALSAFASIEAEDGDDFEGIHGDVILRVECTARDIHKARDVLDKHGYKPK